MVGSTVRLPAHPPAASSRSGMQPLPCREFSLIIELLHSPANLVHPAAPSTLRSTRQSARHWAPTSTRIETGGPQWRALACAGARGANYNVVVPMVASRENAMVVARAISPQTTRIDSLECSAGPVAPTGRIVGAGRGTGAESMRPPVGNLRASRCRRSGATPHSSAGWPVHGRAFGPQGRSLRELAIAPDPVLPRQRAWG